MNPAEHIAFYHAVAKFLIQMDSDRWIYRVINTIPAGAESVRSQAQ